MNEWVMKHTVGVKTTSTHRSNSAVWLFFYLHSCINIFTLSKQSDYFYYLPLPTQQICTRLVFRSWNNKSHSYKTPNTLRLTQEFILNYLNSSSTITKTQISLIILFILQIFWFCFYPADFSTLSPNTHRLTQSNVKHTDQTTRTHDRETLKEK